MIRLPLRTLAVWLMLVVIVLTGWHFFAVDQGLAATPYRDPQRRFSLHPPARWMRISTPSAGGTDTDERLARLQVNIAEHQRGIDALGVAAAFLEDQDTSGFSPTMTIAVRNLPSDWGSPDQPDQVMRRVLNSSGPLSPVWSRPRTVHHLIGAEAYYEYTQTFRGHPLDLSSVAVALLNPRDDQCFLLTMTASRRRFRTYRQLFDRAVRTFHVEGVTSL